MTIRDAITTVDSQKPNVYSTKEKIDWLSQLDGITQAEVFSMREGGSIDTFTPYTMDDENRELLIPHPYDQVYIHWLESKIDYANAEYGKFNNSNAMFDAEYEKFKRWYNREHLPNRVSFSYY